MPEAAATAVVERPTIPEPLTPKTLLADFAGFLRDEKPEIFSANGTQPLWKIFWKFWA